MTTPAPIFDCDIFRAGYPAQPVTPCGFTTDDAVEWTRHLEQAHPRLLPSRKD